MLKIIPSILAKTSEEFFDLVKKLEPHTDRVQLDIIDGIFADNITITGYEELANLKTNLKFEVHLMVQKPADQLVHWYTTDLADRIILHTESEGDMLSMLTSLEEHGKERVLAFNPATDQEKYFSLIPHCHHVQFMAVQPGFYGSPFLPEIVDKVAIFHGMHRDATISVDGGMTPQTVPLMWNAGASILVAGSYVLKSEDPGKAIKDLESCTTS